MSRIIVASSDGEVLGDLELHGEKRVRRQVVSWVRTLPNLPIYVDGLLVSDELRKQILLCPEETRPEDDDEPSAQSPPPPQTARAGPITPGEFTAFNQLLGQAADEVLQAQMNVIQQAQSFAAWQIGHCARMGEAMFERDKMAADEAVRQRRMTHQSLQDIDLLERSIKVQEVTELFQTISKRGVAANARMSAPPRGSSPMDWVNAIATVVTGAKPGEQKPGESK